MLGTGRLHLWRGAAGDWHRYLEVLADSCIVPVAQIIALAGVGWPTFLAMNSGRGYEWTEPAAVVSLGLSLLIAYLVSVKVCRPQVATNAVASPLASAR